MSSLHFWLKVSRPHHCLAAGLAAWVSALLSNGTEWLTMTNLAAASSIALGCLGASVFHYGAANRMYARKYWDLIPLDNPICLQRVGLAFMLTSVIIAVVMLNLFCVIVTFYNTVAIILYARWLAKHWASKNLVIALVCTTPVLLGWFSGHRLNPVVPYGLGAVFCAYWAREIIKDVSDIRANQGIRVTLPIWLGIKQARKVAGGFQCISVVCLLLLSGRLLNYPVYVLAPFSLALTVFGATAWSLFHGQRENSEARWIVYGTWMMICTFFGVRFAYALQSSGP
ncbi:MAG: UbiA family prenyltransferase [bacterium]|nr:UbiA family prenyltransferase [bacterium]